MTDWSKKFVVTLILIITSALAVPAAAQELSIGYQVQRFSSEGNSFNAPFGVSFSVAGPTSGALSLVGQLDWSRKHESATVLGTSVDGTANFTGFAGGLRWSGRGNPGATPFVEALVGAMHTSGSAHVAGVNVGSDSGTDAMMQFGGGVSVPVAGGLGFFGQFDYRRIFAEDTGVNGLRFVGGIRLTAR
jgi:hypothetical protein